MKISMVCVKSFSRFGNGHVTPLVQFIDMSHLTASVLLHSPRVCLFSKSNYHIDGLSNNVSDGTCVSVASTDIIGKLMEKSFHRPCAHIPKKKKNTKTHVRCSFCTNSPQGGVHVI